jgi:hypothetical protein
MRYLAGAALLLALLFWHIRSSPPDYVKTFETPLPGVTLTFETWSLPLTSDNNRLVVHYEHNGKKDSRFILQGVYAQFYRYVWVGPQRLELCWKSGEVFDFTNEVTLRAGGGSQHFHVALREDCAP